MKLTVKQAIDQGYTHYGIAGLESQGTNELHDDAFEEVEEEEREDLVLFEKKPIIRTITKKRIGELIADEIAENCEFDDNEDVYKAVIEIDYSEIAKTINTALEAHKYWMLTDIQLVKEEEK